MLIIYYCQITILLKNTLIGIEKLNSRQLCCLLVYTRLFTSTSQKYLNDILKADSLDWKQIYLLPRLVTVDSYSPPFQDKTLENFVYLSKAVYFSKIDVTSFFFLQTFWWDSTRSILRMQYTSKSTEWTSFILRKQIHSFWSNTGSFLLDFLHVDSELLLIQNYLLLIFSIYVYNSRRSESLKIKSKTLKNIDEKV